MFVWCGCLLVCVCVCVCYWIETGLLGHIFFFGSDRPTDLLESLSPEWMVVLSGSDGSLSVLSLSLACLLVGWVVH